jgi:hypothetical protein
MVHPTKAQDPMLAGLDTELPTRSFGRFVILFLT